MQNSDAQFMLLAAFIIAIGLVVTTVMLNSIIFEGNKAIEAGAESSKFEIVNLMQISRDEVRYAYRNATAGGGSINNFNSQMNGFGYFLPAIYALHGEGVNVSWENWSNKGYAYFTENGTIEGASGWTVGERVKNITVFELRNVAGSNFEVNVTNQTNGAFLWSMKLGGGSQITLKNASGSTRDITLDYVDIDLLNGTWGAYSFNSNVGNSIIKITFNRGSNARGMFNITGSTAYGMNFIRARDYVLNTTVTLSTSRINANITIPVTVPW